MSEAKTMDQVITPEYAIYQGDCIDVLRGLPDASVHYSIFPSLCRTLQIF